MIDEKMGHVSFGQALKDYFRGYVEFRGRSTRAGYWWVQLLLGVIWVILWVWLVARLTTAFVLNDFQPDLAVVLPPLVVMSLVVLATFLPSLALAVRRYRDAGLRGRGFAVLWGIRVAIAATSLVTAYRTLVLSLQNLGSAAAPMVADNAGQTLLMFVSTALGLFLFVLTLLPSDAMVTRSANGFVRFFIRAREVDGERVK